MRSNTLIFVSLLLFAGLCKAGYGEPKGIDSLLCLEIRGKVSTGANKSNNTYKVQLIKGNLVIDSAEVNDRKAFKFILERDTYYGIIITKEGFVPRLISICTDLKSGEFDDKFFKFHFDTELISKQKSEYLNKDALDFPIAVISFNDKHGWFNYNKRYTAEIKRKIYSRDLAMNKIVQKGTI